MSKRFELKFFYPMVVLIMAATVLGCGNVSSNVTDHHEKLIKQYYAYFNRHDWEKMAAMYADTAEFKDPSLGQGMVRQSRQQIAAKYAELAGMFPDVRDEIVQMYPSGDRHMVVEFVSTGTAPDGTSFVLPICTIFTIENGLITKDFTYYDNFEEPQQ